MPGRCAAKAVIPLLILTTFVGAMPMAAQESSVHVDESGVLRWSASGGEVALFGVNYATPFAYGYRAHERVGADRKASIDADVAHLARLGLDAFRIHVWDREISDLEGNLLENDHLDLLDYLIARLQERGIKTILTPIAWWATGYPEPAPDAPGFSEDYSKGEMTTDPVARAAQVNYLKQFIVHTNPYNGRTYRDDPDVIAVELFNEPDHPGSPDETTAFIDALAGALREVGFAKPIFYNISQGYSDAHGHAVCAAQIEGVSVQWYPTGLVRNQALHGNMLPNVDQYPLPFANFPECRDKARMVYEFDAADVAGSYMYPAMARAFRGAGFQWATQFAYDPMAIAWSNTEYQTHFLNLVYTPSKAISYMIAGEVFRQVPRGASYGAYPESERFGPFRVSYDEDLSEMVSDTAFFYSNDTATAPLNPAALRHVAGVGSSPVVDYDGTGAYFLDRISDGVWRLEVYPDVAVVADPFSRGSLQRRAVRVVHRMRTMRVMLQDLMEGFRVEPLNADNDHRATGANGSFVVRPGVYLLSAPGAENTRSLAEAAYGERLGEYFAPESDDSPTDVLHTARNVATTGMPLVVEAEVVSIEPVDSVALLISPGGGGRPRRVSMEPSGGFSYCAEVPADQLRPGLLSYRIAVHEEDEVHTFPEGVSGQPFDWDFTGTDSWTIPVVAPDSPQILFDARGDRDNLLVAAPWEYVPFTSEITAGTMPDRSALRVEVRDLSQATRHFGIRSSLDDSDRPPLFDIPEDAFLRITARSTNDQTDSLEVALVLSDGTAWGSTIAIESSWRQIDLPLFALERVPLVLLPRPYPHFLPYKFMATATATTPDLSRFEGVQFGLGAQQVEEPGVLHGFEVERVELRR